MQPNHPSAKILVQTLAAMTMLLVSACATQAPPPPPPAPVQPPPPPPQPKQDWRDAPITPGDWRWGMEGEQSVAHFAGDTLVLRCNRGAGTVTLLRTGFAQGPVPMTILTETTTQPLTGIPQASSPPAIAVTFTARDPLLDAIAFSRGRFAVEATGLPTLYVPSWPEVSRVIGDCR